MTDDAYLSETVATVSAAAVHPEWALLDDDGHPVLDENGEPVRREATS